MAQGNQINIAYLFATLTVLGWALGIVIGRYIHAEVPPIGLTFWRWSIAGLCLMPWAFPFIREEIHLILKIKKQILWMGIFMIGASTLSMISVNYTKAMNVSIVNAGQPLTTALIAWLVFKEKLGKFQSFGIFLGCIGIITMASRANITNLLEFKFNIGDLIMLIAILGFGSYANTLRTIPKELSLSSITFSVIIAGCLFLLPFYLYETIVYRPMPPDKSTIFWVIILATLTTLIPTYLWNASVSAIGANRSAIFVNLIPVFGSTLAIIFLNEQLRFFHIIGATSILIGILFTIRR